MQQHVQQAFIQLSSPSNTGATPSERMCACCVAIVVSKSSIILPEVPHTVAVCSCGTFVGAEEDTCISSIVNPEQQTTPEKKGEACELSANLAGGNEECMEIDKQGEEDTVDQDEASARLLQQLEPQHDPHSAEQNPQQQLQLQHLGGATQDRNSRDPRNPEEEEKTKLMEADLHQRLSLDDVGKDGLSAEHAAGQHLHAPTKRWLYLGVQYKLSL